MRVYTETRGVGKLTWGLLLWAVCLSVGRARSPARRRPAHRSDAILTASLDSLVAPQPIPDVWGGAHGAGCLGTVVEV